jgi:hypothetical protein
MASSTSAKFRRLVRSLKRKRTQRRRRQTRRLRRQRGGFLPRGFGGLGIPNRAVRTDPAPWEDDPDASRDEV